MHGATSWKDYLRPNTDHKVIGIQYLVLTFIAFVIAGLYAEGVRAQLAQPGEQLRQRPDLQRPVLRCTRR